MEILWSKRYSRLSDTSSLFAAGPLIEILDSVSYPLIDHAGNLAHHHQSPRYSALDLESGDFPDLHVDMNGGLADTVPDDGLDCWLPG